MGLSFSPISCFEVYFSLNFSRFGYHLKAKIVEPGKKKFFPKKILGTSP